MCYEENRPDSFGSVGLLGARYHSHYRHKDCAPQMQGQEFRVLQIFTPDRQTYNFHVLASDLAFHFEALRTLVIFAGAMLDFLRHLVLNHSGCR